VLGISGSLREKSSNTGLLRTIGVMMPVGMEFPMYNGLANLPPFNPDLDDDNAQLHEAVRGWRKC